MDNITILVLSNPNERGLAQLEGLPESTTIAVGNDIEAFRRAAPEAQIILNWTGSRKLLEQVWAIAPKVKWVHSKSAGLDSTLFPALVEGPVPLTNGGGVFSDSLGEVVI